MRRCGLWETLAGLQKYSVILRSSSGATTDELKWVFDICSNDLSSAINNNNSFAAVKMLNKNVSYYLI